MIIMLMLYWLLDLLNSCTRKLLRGVSIQDLFSEQVDPQQYVVCVQNE